MPKTGFTLIELLIVVAIIAILAAIAVPNFLEAQIRSKTARAKNDLRTIAAALETYAADNNRYPHGNRYGNSFYCPTFPFDRPTLERLTTPIAYLAGEAAFLDPFANKGFYSGDTLEDTAETVPKNKDEQKAYRTYKFWPRGPSYSASAAGQDRSAGWENLDIIPRAERWLLEAAGPDQYYNNISAAMRTTIPRDNSAAHEIIGKAIYDPTNGSRSRGSIWRWGGAPAPKESGKKFYDAVSR